MFTGNGQGINQEWVANMISNNEPYTAPGFKPSMFSQPGSHLDRSIHIAPSTTSFAQQPSSQYGAAESSNQTQEPIYEDPTLAALAYGLMQRVYSTPNAMPSDANDPSCYLQPLDEIATFGTEEVRSMVVCGPPGSGKTETIKNILLRLAFRIDVTVVFTKSISSIPWFESTDMKQYVFTDCHPDIIMWILHEFRSYQARHSRLGVCCIVVDDILVNAKDKNDASRLWMDELIKTGHRAGILLIIGCHSLSNIWGGASREISIKIQVGLPKNARDQIMVFWAAFCSSKWPDFNHFLTNVYGKAVAERGHGLVVQSIGNEEHVNSWQPSLMREPLLLGHRDLWIATHMWTAPVRFYINTTDENGVEKTLWPDCNNASFTNNGPGMDILRMQQAGIEIDQQVNKLISVAAPAGTAKKTRAKKGGGGSLVKNF